MICFFLFNLVLYETTHDIKVINQMVLSDLRAVNNWFYKHFKVLNPGKSHFMSIDKLTLRNSNEEEILGIIIDRKLTFHQHIKSICRKAGQKLSALIGLSPCLDTKKRRIMSTSMIKSQFSYCPLVWISCQRRPDSLINNIQEKAFQITYNDQLTNFKILSSKHNEITTHQRNFQGLMTEI